MPATALFRLYATIAFFTTPCLASSKRGLAYNDNISIARFGVPKYQGLPSQIAWAYNWDSTTTEKHAWFEYGPMLWSDAPDHTAQWAAHVAAWLAAGSTHLLGFNEPELASQAVCGRRLQEVDDAVRRLGAARGAGCVERRFTDFKNFVTKICMLAGGRQIWITEFEGFGTVAQQATFLAQALPWLDGKAFVARYAYFGSADPKKLFLSNGGPSLSSLGYQFAFSSVDKGSVSKIT